MNDYEFHEFVAARLGEIAKPRITKRELIAAMAMQGLASVHISSGVTDANIAHDVGLAAEDLEAAIDRQEAVEDDIIAAAELRGYRRRQEEEAAQEPVAWYLPSEDGYDSCFRDNRTITSCTGNPWAGWIPLYAAPPSAPVGKDDDAHAVMQAFAAGFSVTKNLPCSALTNEANAELAWSVSRTAPPYCDKQGVRIWSGPTASAAVSKGFAALGMTLSAPPAAQAVDLEQFRGTVEWAKDYAQATLRNEESNPHPDPTLHEITVMSIKGQIEGTDRLLAIIDQQAGKGMSDARD